MHPSEKFHQNLLVEFSFIKDFNFLIQEMKQKIFCQGFVVVQNIGGLQICHVLLKQPAENDFVFRKEKDYWTQIHGMFINEDHLGQDKFLHLFKVTG